ncbi:YpiB family protein [Hutsoniella sourekii]
MTMVVNLTKIEFFSWILDHFPPLQLPTAYFFQFLMKEPKLLDQIIITEHVQQSPRGIRIDLMCQDPENVVYFKNQIEWQSLDQVFHDLRLSRNKPNDFYCLELVLPDYYYWANYYQVFEENPYLISPTLSDDLDQSLKLVSLIGRMNQLTQALNQALDGGHPEVSAEYLQQINRLKEEYHVARFKK